MLQFFACVFLSYIIVGMVAFERSRTSAQKRAMEEEINNLKIMNEESKNRFVKKTQELKAILSERENFILKFSHEIRNPLNSLLGNIEVLIETISDDKALEMLQDAKVCGEILLQLLNNVLDTAKISSHQLEVSVGVCSIREFMEKMWIVCTEIIRKKRLTGTLCLDVNTPDYLDFDKHRLMQIMINMVSNATKFTDKGYVRIYGEFIPGTQIDPLDMKPKHLSRVGFSFTEFNMGLEEFQNNKEFNERENYNFETLTAASKRFSKSTTDLSNRPSSLADVGEKINEERPGYLRIEIVDSGCGMTAEQTSSLFKKFGQVNEESQKRQIGTGLGLWITKELVEIMDGKIEVYSAANYGTCFVIMIKSHSRIVAPAMKRSTTGPSSQLNLKIDINCMVVEDIPYNQEINRKFLEKCGIGNILLVSNGREAIDLFMGKPSEYFAFILLDLDTPVLDGKEACQMIRNYEKEMGWKPTKIIVLTANTEPATQCELLDINGPYKADVFLNKPASYDTLLSTLKELNILENEECMSIRSDVKRKKKVLVAEDDMFNLDMMQKMLSALGLDCISAANGNEAVKAFELNRKDIGIVLMDCEMPIINGFEATEQLIKNLDPGRQVPIIGLSGHSGHYYETKAKESGMEMLLTKPVSINQLRSLFKSENIID